jgi:hypothetical protein
MVEKWTVDQMPDQHGRTAVVTGANSVVAVDTLPRKFTDSLALCRNV